MSGKEVAQAFAEILKEKELVYSFEEQEDGAASIRIPYAMSRKEGNELEYQISFIISSAGDKMEVHSWPWRGIPAELTQAAIVLCNYMSCRRKWVKWTLDSDNDIHLSSVSFIGSEGIDSLKSLFDEMRLAISEGDDEVLDLLS